MQPSSLSLSWLPAAPDDFSARTGKDVVCTGAQLRQLATHALDTNQLVRLARLYRAHCARGDALSPLTQVTMGILSHGTTELIAPAITGSALRHGIGVQVIETAFNQLASAAFAPQPVFGDTALDLLLIALDHRGLVLPETPGDVDAAQATVDACMAQLTQMIARLRQQTGAHLIVQNLVPPTEAIFGSYEAQLPGTTHWLIAQINRALTALTASDVTVFDVAALAGRIGLMQWHDARLWHMAKQPFAPACIPRYSEHLSRIFAAKWGKSRRCLVLDLDNTVWGGIIGDDGMEGIRIGQGDAVGEAHLAIQHLALRLRARGCVLAVCSKNEDAVARRVFREHPDMALREEHIAVFQANWTDKAANIRAIADTLALGLESMVLLDDNPAERMQVRRELPQVAVPELPDDAAGFAHTLIDAGYFEAITFSQEDRQRADDYQRNAARAALLEQSSDMEGYLASLAMQIHFAPFDAAGRARIAQLISKSNQFNLTTRRYSEAQVAALQEDAGVMSLQVRLKDTLGDNGMISVVICHKHTDHWHIDTWLMSCRVLGRMVEEAVLQEMIRQARAAGATRLTGSYIPTERNIIVKDHYAKLGFTQTEALADGTTHWQLAIATITRPPVPMSITHADAI